MREINWVEDMKLLKEWNKSNISKNIESKEYKETQKTLEMLSEINTIYADQLFLNHVSFREFYKNQGNYSETVEGVIQYVTDKRPKFKKIKIQ